MRVLVEQRHREIDRARNRGARRPADRRLHDFIGDGIRRFRALDHPPRDDDLLVGGSRPLEIGHRDLAVRAALQRLQELLGDDGLRVTLALDRQFVHVHRIGDVDGQEPVRHRRTVWIPCRPIGWPGPLVQSGFLGSARQHPRHRRRQARLPQARPRSRHTSASLPSRRLEAMVTRKLRRAKGEHHLSFTFGLAVHCPDSGKFAAPRFAVRYIAIRAGGISCFEQASSAARCCWRP